MRLSKLVLWGLLGYLILFLGVSFYQSVFQIENQLFNLTTIALTICLCFVLSMFLMTADNRSAPLILLLCLITGFWFLFRLLVIRLSPDSISYQYIIQADATALNFTLLYFILATIFAGLAFKVGANIPSGRRLLPGHAVMGSSYSLPFSAMSAMLLGSISLLVYIIADYGFGVGRGAEIGHFQAVMLLLFNYDIWLLIVTVSVADQWKSLTRIKRTLVVSFYVVFVVMRVLYGSKSAVYVALSTFLFYCLAKGIDFRFRRRHLVVLALLGVISIVGFAYGDAFRKVRALGSITKEEISAQALVQNVGEYITYDSISQVVISVTSRLSILEYLIVNLNQPGDQLSEYVNLVNPIKMVINLLLPGTIFPDVLYSSRYFQVVYAGQSAEMAAVDYYTDMWPIYGLFYIYFGELLGLIAIFLSCLLLGWLFQRAREIRSRYRILLATFIVYLIHEFILSMGIDEWVQRIVLYVLSGALALILLHMVELIRRVMSSFRALPIR